MNHFKKIAGVLEAHGLDAVLLTCEANRFYASGFHSSGTDGVAIVTRNHNYYFTRIHLIKISHIQSFLMCQLDKFRLNKIAARWPTKAVAQFYFY